MIKNIRIRDIKAVKSCDLVNLGKMNIICGKNNSGKSTLLEGTASEDHCFPGIRINVDQALNFSASSLIDSSIGGRKVLRCLAERSFPEAEKKQSTISSTVC